MLIAEAVELVRVDSLSESQTQTWCDLGCGTGIFTLALATLLPPGSVIHAFDKNEKSLTEIPDQYQGVRILKKVVNLRTTDLSLPVSDGVLMANLLHYIENQAAFVERIRVQTEQLLIVEYDHRPRSVWIPHPVGFSALQSLLLEQGFTEVAKLRTRPSRFGGELYSALAHGPKHPEPRGHYEAPTRSTVTTPSGSSPA
jgi:Methyltransferase domain